MTDNYDPYDPAASPTPPAQTPSSAPHPPYPWVRLAYSAVFAIVAWLLFWGIVILAALQFITTAVAGTPNAELKNISQGAVRCMRQLLDYIVFAREELPFPFAPFPQA